MALRFIQGFGTVAVALGGYCWFNQTAEIGRDNLVAAKTEAASKKKFLIDSNTAAYQRTSNKDGNAEFRQVQVSSVETRRYVDQGMFLGCPAIRSKYFDPQWNPIVIKAIVVGDKVPENACDELQSFHDAFHNRPYYERD